ncbi:hypothetical protein E3N88_29072 [Mikania micrantha]|uniref:Uncharacterized protein n=1 Tax=Mikania micrantha TaxID=192012 RepID=A0A5N6N1W2_9ASTR|nr:hypothetical protein E3N88_29072 [Mikania micrantha]
MTMYKDTHLWKRLPAYDGIPFVSKEFKITLLNEDDSSRSIRTLALSPFDIIVMATKRCLSFVVTLPL